MSWHGIAGSAIADTPSTGVSAVEDVIANAAGDHGATASASTSRHPNFHIADRLRVNRN